MQTGFKPVLSIFDATGNIYLFDCVATQYIEAESVKA
jgi:hypothetical protein